ncbi:MAG: glycosyltransferase family 2 protein [Gemmatimonadota bacterium]
MSKAEPRAQGGPVAAGSVDSDAATGRAAVAVVILNWNGWRDTCECLRSLDALDHPEFQVIVCDNGSTDDSLERLRSSTFAQRHGWRTLVRAGDRLVESEGREAREGDGNPGGRADRRPLVLIDNGENLGFSAGNNVGIRYALGSSADFRYIWTLNNDTTVAPETLSRLVSSIEREEGIGSVQSLLLQFEDRDRIDSAGIELRRRGGARDTLLGESASKVESSIEDREIFGCCAASALYRSDALRAAGAFDEAFFLINEDSDLAFRLRRAGYSARLSVASKVYHKRGVSSPRKNRRIAFIARGNKMRLTARWWPRLASLPTLLLDAVRLLPLALAAPGLGVRDWLSSLGEVAAEYRAGASAETRAEFRRRWMK